VNDNDIPNTDELLEIGFQFGPTGDYLYQYITPNGLEVVVNVETNRRADNYCMAVRLTLFWSYTALSGKIMLCQPIRDNPTLGQIKTLVTALKGE